ncbi:MAG: hypothetical protein BRC25_01415 [Parcubacteria group bacterium SW_6_46_9]|nr:MAG: hypothetical protein BRC25_01415 [Parcubacteria group bacterium SW_6_46_9]
MGIENNISPETSNGNNQEREANSPESEPEKLEEPGGNWVHIGIDKTNTPDKEKHNTFNAQQGTMVYVDSGGSKYVAPHSNERAKDLQEKGYEFDSGVGVPFCREKPEAGTRERAEWDEVFN